MRTALTIAGSDSSGGAGIQADLKTMTSLGVYGASGICALTAQNTLGVEGVVATDPSFIELQMDCVFSDIRPDAVKIGMLPTPGAVHAVARGLARHGARRVVLDPVMVATSGASLSEDAAVEALVSELLPLSDVVTPNIAEAEVLCGHPVESLRDMSRAGAEIAARGCRAVLVKGGHIEGEESADVLVCSDGREEWFTSPRVDTGDTHGTGCTLSSAIASYLALGEDLPGAIRRGKAYLHGALRAGSGLGRGSGPVNHMWCLPSTPCGELSLRG